MTLWAREMLRIHLREEAKLEITTESPLLPWLVRHCGWILSGNAVRADGRTGYSRLKRREYTAGISIFGEVTWYKLPKTADLTKLDDRWRTAIWPGNRIEAMNTSSAWRLEQYLQYMFDGRSGASAGMKER